MGDHHVQVDLDEERFRRLSQHARLHRVSIGAIIRDAIDSAHPPDRAARRGAIGAVLAAEPSPVPEDPGDLRRELDQARSHDR